jgi:hypothetical protein
MLFDRREATVKRLCCLAAATVQSCSATPETSPRRGQWWYHARGYIAGVLAGPSKQRADAARPQMSDGQERAAPPPPGQPTDPPTPTHTHAGHHRCASPSWLPAVPVLTRVSALPAAPPPASCACHFAMCCPMLSASCSAVKFLPVVLAVAAAMVAVMAAAWSCLCLLEICAWSGRPDQSLVDREARPPCAWVPRRPPPF